ncbi:MAG: glycosyltransferase family 4 protein [Blastochloris sp.]|nr:glycosyltransferase family 4 protein [Blastochloris sp.]
MIVDSPPSCAMPDVYAAADVFLFPTIYDPFANVTLEAMAAGLPVITTEANGGSQVLVHGNNGFVVSHNRCVKEMVELVSSLRDSSLRQSIGAAAKETAGSWSLERNVKATLALIQERGREISNFPA